MAFVFQVGDMAMAPKEKMGTAGKTKENVLPVVGDRIRVYLKEECSGSGEVGKHVKRKKDPETKETLRYIEGTAKNDLKPDGVLSIIFSDGKSTMINYNRINRIECLPKDGF